jgi:hypothetical protein
MDELDVAPIEAMLHSLGQTLEMGVATDVEDPIDGTTLKKSIARPTSRK